MRGVSIPLWLSLLSLGFLDPCCVDCIFASPLARLSFFLSKPGRVWFSCFVFGFCCCCCWKHGRVEPDRRNRGLRFSFTALGSHVFCSHRGKTSRSSGLIPCPSPATPSQRRVWVAAAVATLCLSLCRRDMRKAHFPYVAINSRALSAPRSQSVDLPSVYPVVQLVFLPDPHSLSCLLCSNPFT